VINSKANNSNNQDNDHLIRWLARHIVAIRIPQNIQNGNNYFNLISSFNSQDMWRIIIADSYLILVKLLHSEKPQTDNDRDSLNCIAAWFGMVTLGRNKPILN